ncbi:hypothetical protein [Mesorhizobium sp.]|nr:hypothetical protein [Mesorhizobium sp.]RWA79110.1 MAG: hypothetical protein EOQ30_26630 [Mesorhizobium sp.]RWD98479.1 MAG: hypothetical protein EOS40_23945 [Mesorhizobium sp.]
MDGVGKAEMLLNRLNLDMGLHSRARVRDTSDQVAIERIFRATIRSLATRVASVGIEAVVTIDSRSLADISGELAPSA